ncbi:MAG TPA: protocatechuate 3,4-dioxygenase subunit alpha [Terriglobales bacterium]|nr:protocatechuate 3,4-dioxygenase subunit alpha [Terriglobales bacterium]
MKPDMDLDPSPSQTVGPFFQIALTAKEHCVPCLAGPQAKGERTWITFRVLDGDGAAVDDAMLEIWQADANGKYNHPDDRQPKSLDEGWIGFGRLATGEDGSCVLETVRPGRVHHDTIQAPHLTVAIFARGMLKQLFTRVYFPGDPSNDEDPILALVPSDRHHTLMAKPDSARPGHWRFDVWLQGDQETVFFDV